MSKPFSPAPMRLALDGREIDLLHYIYSRPNLKLLHNNPQAVLTAINDYSLQHNPLVNIGPTKGAFIRNLISTNKPNTMIELGGYVGYSAILFGEAMRAHGGKYLSLEKNPEMAAVANQLIELAGLRDVVRVIVGSASESLLELIKETKEIDSIPMIFIDHWQELYLPDLWLLEELRVLVPGTVVIADNVIFPGAPLYLEWVRATSEEKRGLKWQMEGGKEFEGGKVCRDPGLVYETVVTEFETPFGRDGVAVTKVLGRED